MVRQLQDGGYVGISEGCLSTGSDYRDKTDIRDEVVGCKESAGIIGTMAG